MYNNEEFSLAVHGASGEKWTSKERERERESLYVVARMSARDIYDRGSVSSGGGAQNNASRAYMRLVARDALRASQKSHVHRPADA